MGEKKSKFRVEKNVGNIEGTVVCCEKNEVDLRNYNGQNQKNCGFYWCELVEKFQKDWTEGGEIL